jgi:hypothetical protein
MLMPKRWPRSFVDNQPLASLAYPHLSGRQRALAIDSADKLTIGDARDFLAGVGCENELEVIFTTERRQGQLARAVDVFDATITAWIKGPSRDERFAWILPNRLLASVLDGRITSTLAKRLSTVAVGNDILDSASAYIWLPYVALETTNELRHLRSGDQAVISIMIARGCRALGFEASGRPWRPGFPSRVAALPTSWLFQFEPTSKGSSVLDRLMQSGLTNIGHLVVLHPDAWQLLRTTPPEQWRTLHRALRRVAGLP